MKNVNRLLCFLLLIMVGFINCNKRFYVDKKYVVGRATGILVFPDIKLKRDRNSGSDLFMDSMLPPFFIVHSFQKERAIKRTELESAFFEKKEQKSLFTFLINDCDGERTNAEFEKAMQLNLSRDIDPYLKSKKAFLLPVYIEFIVNNLVSEDYYLLYKKLTIHGVNKSKTVFFSKGYINVLRLDILQNEWYHDE